MSLGAAPARFNGAWPANVYPQSTRNRTWTSACAHSTALYESYTGELDDAAAVLAAILTWIEAHPEDLDHSL